MRIALYARVSTSDQRPEVQLAPLRDYAARNGAEPVEFVDHGVSGRKDRRPGLDALVEALKRQEIGAVAVTKLDRLARSVRHLTQLGAELEALGVNLVVLDQSIDTATPAGRLLFHVLASIGEFEADLCRERTRAGLAAARRRGQRLGRRPALEGEPLRRARRMRAAGRSLRQIGEVLGVSKSSVARALAA